MDTIIQTVLDNTTQLINNNIECFTSNTTENMPEVIIIKLEHPFPSPSSDYNLLNENRNPSIPSRDQDIGNSDHFTYAG